MADDLQTLPDNWQARWVRRLALGLAALLFLGWVAQVGALGPFAPSGPEPVATPLADPEATCRDALAASFPEAGVASLPEFAWLTSPRSDPATMILLPAPTGEVGRFPGSALCTFEVQNGQATKLVDSTWQAAPGPP